MHEILVFFQHAYKEYFLLYLVPSSSIQFNYSILFPIFVHPLTKIEFYYFKLTLLYHPQTHYFISVPVTVLGYTQLQTQTQWSLWLPISQHLLTFQYLIIFNEIHIVIDS